jgi:hypothetical protein
VGHLLLDLAGIEVHDLAVPAKVGSRPTRGHRRAGADPFVFHVQRWGVTMAAVGEFDELAKKFQALEARVAELERHLVGRQSTSATCPVCQAGALKVMATKPDPLLGVLGPLQQVLKCENWACGHTELRQYQLPKAR